MSDCRLTVVRRNRSAFPSGREKFFGPDRTFFGRAVPITRGQDRRQVLLGRCSKQDEIDQRKKGGPDSGGYQCVVGTEVRARLDRRWPGFLGHLTDLDQVGQAYCEAAYTSADFLSGKFTGTGGPYQR